VTKGLARKIEKKVPVYSPRINRSSRQIAYLLGHVISIFPDTHKIEIFVKILFYTHSPKSERCLE